MFVHVLLTQAQEEHDAHTSVHATPWHGLRYFRDDWMLMHSLVPIWQHDGLCTQSESDAQYFSPIVVVVVCATGVGDLERRRKDIRNTKNMGRAIWAWAFSFLTLRTIMIYPAFPYKNPDYFLNSKSIARWLP